MPTLALTHYLHKINPYDLHLHAAIPDFCKESVKSPHRRILKILVAEHIAPAGYLQVLPPFSQLRNRSFHRKIGSYILNLCILDPGFQHHFDGSFSGRIKYQLSARKGLCHSSYKRLYRSFVRYDPAHSLN